MLLLQSCHMANDLVDESAVYLTTGNPLPADIESVVNWLLNEPFVTAFHSELLLGAVVEMWWRVLVRVQVHNGRHAMWRTRQQQAGPPLHAELLTSVSVSLSLVLPLRVCVCLCRHHKAADRQGHCTGRHCAGAAPVSVVLGRRVGLQIRLTCAFGAAS